MNRVLAAIQQGLEQLASPDCCRLFHGRGQCYAGLEFINVDWFNPVLLITLYQQPEQQSWQQFINALQAVQTVAPCVLVQRRFIRGAPIELLWGSIPEQPLALEQGLKYALAFGGKQNIGFFLDMAPGRAWLKQRAEGKRVLNLFAYTCSLSVAAIAGGAKSVLNIDMSSAALNVGRNNHRLNEQTNHLRRDVQFLSYDIFRSWKKITAKGPYDIIVIDPPSRQKGSFIVDKDYVRVIRRLPALAAKGADILACLNAPELGEDFLHQRFALEFSTAEFVQRLNNRQDFPEQDPQKNLKMLHYTVA